MSDDRVWPGQGMQRAARSLCAIQVGSGCLGSTVVEGRTRRSWSVKGFHPEVALLHLWEGSVGAHAGVHHALGNIVQGLCVVILVHRLCRQGMPCRMPEWWVLFAQL